MRRRRRLWPALVLVPVLLVLLGHGTLWLWAVGRLEAGFASWAEARRAEGWTVSHGPPARAGWPGAAALHLPDLRIEAASGGGAWRAEQPVVLSLAPTDPDRLRIALAGRHRVTTGGGEAATLAARRLDLAVPVRAEAGAALPPWAELEAEALRLDPDGAGLPALGGVAVSLETASRGAGRGEPALTLRLRAEALDLPDAAGAAAVVLGRRVAAVALDLVLSGPVPPPLAAGAPPRSDAWARGWRDGGGSLTLREVRLGWGPAMARGEARLVLDAALQPAGEGKVRLAGAEALLAASAQAGLLAPSAAGVARGMLPFLQRAPADGGPPEIEAPLTLDRGVLAVARLPLVRLPAWTWPAASPVGVRP